MSKNRGFGVFPGARRRASASLLLENALSAPGLGPVGGRPLKFWTAVLEGSG
jgi:hypothetical protein